MNRYLDVQMPRFINASVQTPNKLLRMVAEEICGQNSRKPADRYHTVPVPTLPFPEYNAYPAYRYGTVPINFLPIFNTGTETFDQTSTGK